MTCREDRTWGAPATWGCPVFSVDWVLWMGSRCIGPCPLSACLAISTWLCVTYLRPRDPSTPSQAQGVPR